MNEKIDLNNLVPEFPVTPINEIARDSLVGRISRTFGLNCQKQIIVSDHNYGKTNLLAQFCRQYSHNSISYFFNSNPSTHNVRTFLFVLCNQISYIVNGECVSESVNENDLRNYFTGLNIKLGDYSKKYNQVFYYVIDGIDTIYNGNYDKSIFDDFPSPLKGGPYLLLSSTEKTLKKLPEFISKNIEICDFEAALQFNSVDIEKYFSGYGLTDTEIRIINEKSKGVVGHIEALRDSITKGKKDILYSDSLPENISKLHENQIKTFLQNCGTVEKECAEIISISPKPLKHELLQLYFGENYPSKELLDSSLFIISNSCLIFKQDDVKKIFKNKIIKRKKSILEKILSIVQENYYDDEELLTLLLEELNDYNGFENLLGMENIQNGIKKGEADIIFDRLKKITKISSDDKSYQNLIKWLWQLSAIREFLDHSSNPHKIDALISLREYEKALEKTFLYPNNIGRIKILAKIYSSMKENHAYIPPSSLEELQLLINEMDLSKTETEKIKELAIDILPILPDDSVILLEKAIGINDDKNLIDLAMTSQNQVPDETIIKSITQDSSHYGNSKDFLGQVVSIRSHWLKNKELSYLIKEVDNVSSTKAKEFLIRQWCLQNSDSDELSYGIEFWLETVLYDDNFVISLRSLRQLSEQIKDFTNEDKRRLVERFKISVIDSLKTPWEEWIGFHLNIAESIYSYDIHDSINQIEEIYEIVNTEIADYDIKVFCYARLWGTYKKLGLKQSDDVKNNLERVLSNLISNSALQDEVLFKTLRIIAGIDVSYSLEISNRLNTIRNRNNAKKIILFSAYRKLSPADLSKHLSCVIKNFPKDERDIFLYDLLEKLSSRKTIIDEESQKIVYYNVRNMNSSIDKCIALVALATIWTNTKCTKKEIILNEVVENWHSEKDLRRRILGGYFIVEQLSKIDLEFAKNFCGKVQEIHQFQSASLAESNLGVFYVSTIDLVIRLLNDNHLINNEIIDSIRMLINEIPSLIMRYQLLAQLAAKIYSIGKDRMAADLINEQIILPFEEIEDSYTRIKIIDFCLPIMFNYSPNLAINLSKELPRSVKDFSWGRTVIWLISKGYLGEVADIDTHKISTSPDVIRDRAIIALKQIKQDIYIFGAITALTRAIEYSVIDNRLDAKNAFDILREIEEFVEKNLPDGINISHPGYRIVSLARIHSARTSIHKETKRKSIFISKQDIRNKWNDIESRGLKNIPNTADRFYVLTYIADELRKYDEERAQNLIAKFEGDINKIPSIIDRSDRIENLATTLGNWGKDIPAKYYFSKCIELIDEFSQTSKDKKLEHIIQAAYGISPSFADEMAERIDSRYPERDLPPFKLKLKSLQYGKNLQKLISESTNNHSQLHGFTLQLSINKLYREMISNNGAPPSYQNIIDILYQSSFHHSDIVNDVLKWAIECDKQQNKYSSGDYVADFLFTAKLVLSLTRLLYPYKNREFVKEVEGVIPGINSKVTVFNKGERKKAVSWIKDWIKKNVQDYIKICDPYFGPKELIFLSDITKDVKILIITTNTNFENKEDLELMEQELINNWKRFGKGDPPFINFLIVPAFHEKSFHDRALVSSKCGLNIGPSLNGLGNEFQRFSIIDESEKSEIEEKYINTMLNQSMWIIDYSLNPINIILGNHNK